MDDFPIPPEQRPLYAFLDLSGIAVISWRADPGIVLTSDLGWLPTGHAVRVGSSCCLRSCSTAGFNGGAADAAGAGDRVLSMSPRSSNQRS